MKEGMNKHELILSSYLQSVINPSEEELTAFLKLVNYKTVEKNNRIIKIGNRCDVIYFVIDGFLKYVMNVDGKEIVIHFAAPGNLVSDFYSYYSAQPAITDVFTITDCQLAYVKRKELEVLYDSYKVWEKFGRLVAEKAALKLIFEKIKLQTQSPEEMYTNIISKNPQLLQHIKLGDLAQSLGITQETLSRIRKRIAEG